MEEKTYDKIYREHTFVIVLGITSLTILILAGVAGSAPFAYVTNMGDHHNDTSYNPNVAVVDTETNDVIVRVPLGGGWPVGVAVNPEGTKVYVVDSPMDVSTVYVIDTATNMVSAKVNLGSSYPSGITVNSAGTRVYVTKQHDYTNISVINTATNTLMSPIIVGPNTYNVAFTPNGKKIYATNSLNNTIYVIDAATNEVTANVSVGDSPSDITVTSGGNKVYVANYNSSTVSVIDTVTDNIITTVPVGDSPNLVAVTPEGKKVYVANAESDNVSMIDTATNTVTATVNAGIYPTGVVIAPFTNSNIMNQSTQATFNATEDTEVEEANLSSSEE